MIKIKQFFYPKEEQTDELKFDVIMDPQTGLPTDNIVDWSQNIIEGCFVYKLGIHSLPGHKFKINDIDDSIITIGTSGNFNMDFGDYPIESIRVHKDYINKLETYPLIIDIVYQEREEESYA